MTKNTKINMFYKTICLNKHLHSKEKFNKFFDNPDFDFDAERIRHHIMSELELKVKEAIT